MAQYDSGYNDDQFVAELYDPVYCRQKRADIQFYADLARQAGGTTLELGCGTGRVLIPTARQGCQITGLDLSPLMLQKCREKLTREPPDVQTRVFLVQGDMTAFDTGETYPLITIPFRPFQHLIAAEQQRACLACVRRHLKPRGQLALDVYHPFLPRLTDPRYLMEMQVDPDITLPDGSTLRRTVRTAAFHPEAQYNDVEIIHYVKHPDGRQERLVHAFPMRYFFRYEMEHLLAVCGFKIAEFYGNFDRSPFTADSPEMIFVAEKV